MANHTADTAYGKGYGIHQRIRHVTILKIINDLTRLVNVYSYYLLALCGEE